MVVIEVEKDELLVSVLDVTPFDDVIILSIPASAAEKAL